MIGAVLLVALQAAATPLPAAPPQSFSILADACRRLPGDDIVVCGDADKPRLPLPDERGPPDRPVASNPELTGIGAMRTVATPCAATQWGCQTGVDILGGATAAIRLVGKIIDPDSCCERQGESTDAAMLAGDAIRGLKAAFGKKPDKSQRVAIPLDAPPPVGRLLP